MNGGIRALGNEVSSELTTRRQPPAAMGDVNPGAQPTSRVSGVLDVAPAELTKVDYILDESELRSASPTPSHRLLKCVTSGWMS